MKKEDIIEEMYNCIDFGDLKGFEIEVKNYLKICDDTTASQDLAMFLVKSYTSARADSIAILMEIIIRCNPNLALINYPENDFFRIVMITGSQDLFECYIEEAIDPHLKTKSKAEYKEYYNKLLQIGAELNALFFDQYQTIVKGIDFNGAFANASDDENVVLINKEDYEIMNNTVEKFNTIVGRRNLLKLLIVKSGMKTINDKK